MLSAVIASEGGKGSVSKVTHPPTHPLTLSTHPTASSPYPSTYPLHVQVEVEEETSIRKKWASLFLLLSSVLDLASLALHVPEYAAMLKVGG